MEYNIYYFKCAESKFGAHFVILIAGFNLSTYMKVLTSFQYSTVQYSTVQYSTVNPVGW